MDEVGAFEAKTHLPKLLDRVERGESVTITRHGRPVAQLVRCVRCGGDRALAAFRRIAALRELNPICDFELHEVTSLDVARSYGLLVYDAAYVEVARRLALPLATLDKSLRQADGAPWPRRPGRLSDRQAA